MEEKSEQLHQNIAHLSDLLHSGQDEAFVTSFNALHDFEMGQVYSGLPEQLRAVAWRLLDNETLATVFDNIDVDDEDIDDLLQEMPPQKAVQILRNMYADNEVDLLQEMPTRLVATYLSLMPKDEAEDIRKLINYEEQTAGSLMSIEYLAVEADLRVDEVMRLVKQQALEAEAINYVYVLDKQERLVGVISLRDLLTHPDDMLVSEITKDRIISVKAGDDQQDVAQIVADYNFISIPVTDDNDRLLGVITVDDIVDVIDEEAVEDYSGLAAVNVSQTDDTAWHSAIKRIPWLIALLLLGMSTATLISSFDGLVRKASILAVFISLITGTAGNAGTQALALAVRRLAVGSNNSAVKNFLSEILAGFLVGTATGFSVFLIVTFWKHNYQLGLAVGIAMAIAIMVANLAGYLIPVLIDKLGMDPAVASSPFITTLSDLTSVLIYFNIAQLFISHFTGA
ncbi:magnesium transporter [Leuconostoc suionicum]|uniref:magnesium transporter n=1 Tax=Leuconostoc suionicum TaxID=1511761 RepID=UPI0024AE587C|nr:magnesium transporter [Leuconostoc suionicum]MDI6497083.1 magnesium transporter [Leuconostoc suionicum]MDI6499211.1 magnesium transporter [Leuconostoc suionicum]MDI6501303.1 magnesium transporter [Leuconostoc suionicum]MDI6613006.1 magnesium transporter [Leuconostoc suionicum]MDI6664208.1 magnesium transporter [Leuconostoc suionicum]